MEKKKIQRKQIVKVLQALLAALLLAALPQSTRGQHKTKCKRVKILMSPLVQPDLSNVSASSIAKWSLTPWKYR